jgi:hypothetical protein
MVVVAEGRCVCLCLLSWARVTGCVCEVDNQQREGDDVGGGAFVLFCVGRLNCMGTDSNFDLQQQSDGRRYVKAASNRWSRPAPKVRDRWPIVPPSSQPTTDPALSAKLSPLEHW